MAAVIVPGGAVPVGEIPDLLGSSSPTDIFSLLESGRFYELWRFYDDAAEDEVEELSARATPLSEVEYGPLYRRPRKIWNIGLNYVEHAGDLAETAPSEEPASFMRPDTTVIGSGEEVLLPEQSRRVTGEAELGLVIGARRKTSPRRRRRPWWRDSRRYWT